MAGWQFVLVRVVFVKDNPGLISAPRAASLIDSYVTLSWLATHVASSSCLVFPAVSGCLLVKLDLRLALSIWCQAPFRLILPVRIRLLTHFNIYTAVKHSG